MSKKSNGRKPAAAKRASGAADKGQPKKGSVSSRKPTSATKATAARGRVAERESARPRRTSVSTRSNGTGESAPSPAAATEVKVSAAKGRPMLTWVGKRPLKHVKSFPAQPVESFAPGAGADAGERRSDWPARYPGGGLLFHGDNKEVLGHLLANGFRGKVNLIYIDPPFDSGADYVRNVSLRGAKGAAKLDGETYTLGEQIQYTDIWANDNYLQFMYERLLLLKELLADGGSIFLHCDSGKVHHLRCLMDEVFGPEALVNEIIWSYRRWPVPSDSFQAMHDNILFYEREVGRRRTFHRSYEEASDSYMKRFGGKTQRLDEESGSRKITSEEETKGMPTRDVWDISIIAGNKAERVGYPTQKPEKLLEQIVRSTTNEGDLVLDCFIGSGTTAAVAQQLGRRWIGCDINKGAIQTTAKRLQGIITEQIDHEGKLGLDGDRPTPAQLSFTTWRVNDYDLQVQHNEAVNLAAEFLGVQRTRTDSYFDGTLGQNLAKIIPFGRPLTPLDLEELRRELDARPDEDRPITIVCLGMELTSQAWVDEWNALRRGADAVNKIRIVELRTDPKYGGFLKHEPVKARVCVRRRGDRIQVEVADFVSPSIVQRLQQQAGVLAPRIDDWRAMVDCVMIDTAYDGQVFNVMLTDVPERKSDFVQGRYELPAPAERTTVAVKIIDMLGEEVVETCEV